MSGLELLLGIYDAGVLLLALLAAARLGAGVSVRAAQATMTLAALSQIALAMVRAHTSPGLVVAWGWLLGTTYNLALVYALWQAGRLLRAVREQAVARQQSAAGELSLANIRAVASRPGGRRPRAAGL